MAIRIVELLHAGLRVPMGEAQVEKALGFYVGLLGMQRDGERPHIPTIPGAWVNVKTGDRGRQLHIMCAEGKSAAARTATEDPTRAHLAFSVADLDEAQATLAERGIKHWVYESLVGSGSRQVFFEDPFGNMIELQQQR